MHLYTYIALDLANEKTREADRYRLAAIARGERTELGRTRRAAARMLAWVSRSSASVARRLDACIGDEIDSFNAERLVTAR